MAERRMFAKTIIGSGRFLQMPATSRLLYYDLGMEADDDGIVEALRVMRATGSTEDDLRILVAKGFIRVLNNELVSLICDWKTNNYIQKDRYHKSVYAQLIDPEAVESAKNQPHPETGNADIPANGLDTSCIQPVSISFPEVRLGKDNGLSISQTANAVSPEPAQNAVSEAAAVPEIVIGMPLVGGTEFPVTRRMADEWQELYPAVNVEQQLRAMRGWCLANPKNKKTKSGVKRFINSWLNREQNRARPVPGGNSSVSDPNGIPAGTSFNTNEFFEAAVRRSYNDQK